MFFLGVPKPGLEYQRISIDRSKLSEDEAFEHAIDMISSRQMGFRKAADFFQVSKWKLYVLYIPKNVYKSKPMVKITCKCVFCLTHIIANLKYV